MFNKVQESKIKDLLPVKWCTTLAKENNVSKGLIHKVVTENDDTHYLWPNIILMAQKEQDRIRKNREMTEGLLSGKKSSTTKISKRSKLASV